MYYSLIFSLIVVLFYCWYIYTIPKPKSFAIKFLNRRIIEKPWGKEEILVSNKHYIGKILYIMSGHSISLQYHNKKTETMFIESGEGILEEGLDDKKGKYIFEGDVIHIDKQCIHRVRAISDLKIYEFSTPHPNDVVRLKDNYERN